MIQKEKEKIIKKIFKLFEINDVKVLFKNFNKYSKYNIDENVLLISSTKSALNDKLSTNSQVEVLTGILTLFVFVAEYPITSEH